MPPARLLVATRSAHKLREIQIILQGALAPAQGRPVELIDLERAGTPADPAEEDIEAFDSFRENALAKARYFAARAGLPTLADDSGLALHALNGEPGVRSKRFSGRNDLSGAALDAANNRLLLERLRDVPDAARDAHYVCAAAVVRPDGTALVALGTCTGRILHEPAGDGGFGYDPLFFLPALNRTFGELDPAVKNRVSHRARAFRALAAAL